MDRVEIETTTREVLGKKVRFLRRQGITPVHLFGHNVESQALQCDTTQLQHVLAQTGKSTLISLKIDKARKPRNVVVREVQRDPLSRQLIHVDFYQVSMAEKIKVDIPIISVGEAPALKLKEYFLVQDLNELTVECLPDEIPATLELDISVLAEVEQTIRVRDIKLDEGVTVITDSEHLVFKIGIRHIEKAEVEEEVEVPAAAEEPAGESAPED